MHDWGRLRKAIKSAGRPNRTSFDHVGVRIDVALQDHVGIRGNADVGAAASHQIDRLAAQQATQWQWAESRSQRRTRHQAIGRIAAENDRQWHSLRTIPVGI